MSFTATPTGLIVSTGASGSGGNALDQNFRTIDSRIGRCNYTATRAPLTTDNLSSQYGPGSLWINTSANNLYICEAATLISATWLLVTGGGGGSGLTSVGLTNNSGLLTIGSSPLVSNGNLTIDFPAETANKVLVGPASGNTAIPTFRLLNSADLATSPGNTSILSTNGTANAWIAASTFDAAGSAATVNTALGVHIADDSNPHATTATQVGAYTTSAADTLLAAKAPTSNPTLTGTVTTTGGITSTFSGGVPITAKSDGTHHSQDWKNSSNVTLAFIDPNGYFNGGINLIGNTLGDNVSGNVTLDAGLNMNSNQLDMAGGYLLDSVNGQVQMNAPLFMDRNPLDMAGGLLTDTDTGNVTLDSGIDMNGNAITDNTGSVLISALLHVGSITLSNNNHLISSTTTGSKIGTSTTQKFAFWNATPVVQPTAGAATAAAIYSTNEQTMLQKVYDVMRTIGLMS